MKRVLLAWSSGKDSAWTLHVLRSSPEAEVAGLFTTMNADTDRIAVHAVRAELLEAQARAANLPLYRVALPSPCPNPVYEAALAQFAAAARQSGTTHLAFGDLFLEDIRRYRERQFANSGLGLLFPLWGRATRALAEEMMAAGLRAWIVAVDTRQAPREWAGRCFDPAFVAQIPQAVDACGERGEFHTFAFEGPMFAAPIPSRVGELTQQGEFAYADVLSSPRC